MTHPSPFPALAAKVRTASLCLAVALACVVATPMETVAQGLGGPPLTALRTGRAEGLTPEIDGILKRMLAAYKNLDAYADSGRLTMIQEVGRVRQATKMPQNTTFRRPNKLQVVGGIQTVTCDGEQLQIVLDRLYQYKQMAAPSSLGMGHIRMGAPGAGLDQGYPEILEFLLGDDVYRRLLSQIDSIRKRPDPVTIADRECVVVLYQAINKAYITLYIDPETSLLRRIDIDNTEAQRPTGATRDQPTLTVAIQLDPVRTGADVPNTDEGFALRNAGQEGMRRVQQFEAQEPGATSPASPGEGPPAAQRQHPLIGKRAPSIPGLPPLATPALYFVWSPRDGGSLTGVPMVQGLSDAFNKPDTEATLAVVGISARSDVPGFAADVMEAKKASFRNVVDSDASLANAFSINQLPSFVVTGADGIIRHVFQGAPLEIKADLTAAIEALLAES